MTVTVVSIVAVPVKNSTLSLTAFNNLVMALASSCTE